MRIIPRLDIKTENVVKGVCFEGLRVVGNPYELVNRYYNQGADEVLYIDTVASLYRRKNLKAILSQAVEKLPIPLTVGGGIASLKDIEELLHAGADKIAVNTYALNNPSFIGEAAKEFGSQSVVVSINAKLIEKGRWVPWTDNAREPTDIDVFDWIKIALGHGAGEIFLTSIDGDGRLLGLDYELIEKASKIIDVPFVVGGGVASESDIQSLKGLNIDGLTVASFLHYEKGTVSDIKRWAGLNRNPAGFSSPCETKFHLNKNKVVGILEYGCGNIFSLCRSLELIGVSFKIIYSTDELARVDSLILPGVGAFGHAMNRLNEKGFVEALHHFAESNKPILGICLGAQLLLDSSEEFGSFSGLSLIPGCVKKIEKTTSAYKIPNVGWRQLVRGSCKAPNASLETKYFYFTHSYRMLVNEKNSMYEIDYSGGKIAAFVTDGRNVFGAQFHPEKSSTQGLNFLNWFCSLVH